jgi:hypothetical protein
VIEVVEEGSSAFAAVELVGIALAVVFVGSFQLPAAEFAELLATQGSGSVDNVEGLVFFPGPLYSFVGDIATIVGLAVGSIDWEQAFVEGLMGQSRCTPCTLSGLGIT